MAKKKVYQVLVSMNDRQATRQVDTLIELLRYAGLVKPHAVLGKAFSFFIRAPHGLDSEIWANQNAERIRSFQYEAEVVEV